MARRGNLYLRQEQPPRWLNVDLREEKTFLPILYGLRINLKLSVT